MSWPCHKISDFCKTGSGGTPSRKDKSFYANGTIPWIKSGELKENVIFYTGEKITAEAVKKSSTKMVPKGAILLAMYGANVGRLARLGINATTNQAVCNIIPNPKIADADYVFRFLQSEIGVFLKKASGGAQPNISQSIVRDTEIPLPPLAEQKRIAAILDKADAIRRKREQAIKLTDTLLRSVFLDMFGDPVTNPKGWEMGTIRDLLKEAKYGTSQKANTDGNGIPILRMGNITYDGEIDLSDLKYINLDENELSKYTTRRGDILFNRTNSKKLVGKTAVVLQDIPMAIAGYIVRARVNDIADPIYISAYLNSPHGKLTLFHMCKSIVGMANINAQEFQDIKIALPPLSLQKQFREKYESNYSWKRKLKEQSKEIETFLASLTQRAFRGELTSQDLETIEAAE